MRIFATMVLVAGILSQSLVAVHSHSLVHASLQIAKDQSQKTCDACKTKNESKRHYCRNCGKQLSNPRPQFVEVKTCAVSGSRANSACPSTKIKTFELGRVPGACTLTHTPPDGRVSVEVCTVSKQKAREFCPNRMVQQFARRKVPGSCSFHTVQKVEIVICTGSGKKAGPDCPKTKPKLAAASEIPKICDIHKPGEKRFLICAVSRDLATSSCPKSSVSVSMRNPGRDCQVHAQQKRLPPRRFGSLGEDYLIHSMAWSPNGQWLAILHSKPQDISARISIYQDDKSTSMTALDADKDSPLIWSPNSENICFGNGRKASVFNLSEKKIFWRDFQYPNAIAFRLKGALWTDEGENLIVYHLTGAIRTVVGSDGIAYGTTIWTLSDRLLQSIAASPPDVPKLVNLTDYSGKSGIVQFMSRDQTWGEIAKLSSEERAFDFVATRFGGYCAFVTARLQGNRLVRGQLTLVDLWDAKHVRIGPQFQEVSQPSIVSTGDRAARIFFSATSGPSESTSVYYCDIRNILESSPPKFIIRGAMMPIPGPGSNECTYVNLTDGAVYIQQL